MKKLANESSVVIWTETSGFWHDLDLDCLVLVFALNIVYTSDKQQRKSNRVATCGDDGDGELRFSFIGDDLWPSPPPSTHHTLALSCHVVFTVYCRRSDLLHVHTFFISPNVSSRYSAQRRKYL